MTFALLLYIPNPILLQYPTRVIGFYPPPLYIYIYIPRMNFLDVYVFHAEWIIVFFCIFFVLLPIETYIHSQTHKQITLDNNIWRDRFVAVMFHCIALLWSWQLLCFLYSLPTKVTSPLTKVSKYYFTPFHFIPNLYMEWVNVLDVFF